MLKSLFSVYQKCSVTKKYAKNAFSTPLHRLHPSQRLWCLHIALSAVGTLILAPSAFATRTPAQAWCPSATLGLATALHHINLCSVVDAGV